MYTKPTIYLHIGAGKTGSTSIQVWLKEVEPILADSGYLVFDTNFEPSAQHTPLSNQQEYFHSIFLQGDAGIKSFQQQFRKNLHYMHEHGYHSAVMSAENLLNPWVQAHKLFDPLVNDCKWKIIVYVRNQPEYLISAWKQWGYINQDFETYVSNHSLADWMSIITPWDTLFGKDAIYVGILTASLLKNGFLTHDFANAIGVPLITLQHQADIQTNPSINFQTTVLLAKIRRQFLQNNPHFLTNHHTPTSPNKHEDNSDIQETILKNAQLNMLLNYKSVLTHHAAYTSLQKFNSTIAFVEQTTLDTIHVAYNASNQRLLQRYRPDIDCETAFPRIVNHNQLHMTDVDILLHGIHVLLETTQNIYTLTKQHQTAIDSHHKGIAFHNNQLDQIQNQFVDVQRQLDHVQHQLAQTQSALDEMKPYKNLWRTWIQRLQKKLLRRPN